MTLSKEVLQNMNPINTTVTGFTEAGDQVRNNIYFVGTEYYRVSGIVVNRQDGTEEWDETTGPERVTPVTTMTTTYRAI